MIEGIIFKTKTGKRNHIALGVDNIPSLCGSASYFSKDKNIVKLGDRMPLDRLIKAHGNICRKCAEIAEKQIESHNSWFV